MQPTLKKISSKFFYHYRHLLSQSQANDWKIQISELTEQSYGEKERRMQYAKIGSNVEIIENVTIVENQVTENPEALFKHARKKDYKKMYF